MLIGTASGCFLIASPEFIEERYNAFMLYAAVLNALATFTTAAATVLGVDKLGNNGD